MKFSATQSLSISSSKQSNTLSKNQKAFNKLIKQIEQKRLQLAAWEAMIPRYQKKHIDEMVPLMDTIVDLQTKIVIKLDHAHGKKGLTRNERRTLSDLILNLTSSVPGVDTNPELRAIYNRHSDTDIETDIAHDKQMVKEMLEEMMGIELDDDLDLDSPEVFMRQAQAKLAEMREMDAAAEELRQSKRKKTAKQLEREAAKDAEEKDISDSIREVYRKLASALHPDREPDPEERERKNALMQKVNKAYDSRNLLQLLELQLELEHIDPAALAQLSDDRLKRYNTILKDQVRELDMELIHVESDFIARFHVDAFGTLKPESLLRQLEIELVQKNHNVRQMERDLTTFNDINGVKAFLRAMRQLERSHIDDFPF
jgi:hypothetical protein